MTRHERKKQFIEALAKYLTRDLAGRSITLQMGNKEAKDWAQLYGLAGLQGWRTEEEALNTLNDLLG